MNLTDGTSCDYPLLLVDDDQFMRRITEDALVSLGYHVVTACNGREALQLVDQGDYPLIISDWVMPEMDGVELCRKIRASRLLQYTYIILLTSQSRQNDLIQGLEAGADEYLIKPVNHGELTVRLKTARRIIDLERSLQKSLEEIRRLSLTDPLTGIYNRRYLDDRLPQELKRAYRYERSLSIVMMDIDHFKVVNDRFGHQAGDEVLKCCASCMAGSVRNEIDWIARFGGEEFTIVLPETDLNGALIVAERLRRMLAELVITDAGITITASFGIVSHTPAVPEMEVTVQQLLALADQCLYRAKEEGRNRVIGARL